MTATAMEEDVFTGKMDFALWRKMLNFAVPHKGKIFGLLAAGMTISLADMLLPYLTGRIVDEVTLRGASARLGKFILAYAALVACFASFIFTMIMLAGGSRYPSVTTSAGPASTSCNACRSHFTTASPSDG